jgi:hypothetical protein
VVERAAGEASDDAIEDVEGSAQCQGEGDGAGDVAGAEGDHWAAYLGERGLRRGRGWVASRTGMPARVQSSHQTWPARVVQPTGSWPSAAV